MNRLLNLRSFVNIILHIVHNLCSFQQDSTLFYGPSCIETSTTVVPQSSLSIYPNPASDHLMLQPENDQRIVSVRIFNWQGALLLQHTGANLQHCDVSKLRPGSYLLTVEFDNHKKTSIKFLKN